MSSAVLKWTSIKDIDMILLETSPKLYRLQYSSKWHKKCESQSVDALNNQTSINLVQKSGELTHLKIDGWNTTLSLSNAIFQVLCWFWGGHISLARDFLCLWATASMSRAERHRVSIPNQMQQISGVLHSIWYNSGTGLNSVIVGSESVYVYEGISVDLIHWWSTGFPVFSRAQHISY